MIREIGPLTITGTVTSDGYVIGSASCKCGFHVGPGAFLGTTQSVAAINGHNGCSLEES